MGHKIMVKEFIDQLRIFAINHAEIESVIIVGFYARGTNKETSDLDLCIITNAKNKMVETPDFVKEFGIVKNMQIEYYGACISIRVWYENGLEVEFGLVGPSWIKMPLDGGTRKVLNDGYKVVVDKRGHFKNLPL